MCKAEPWRLRNLARLAVDESGRNDRSVSSVHKWKENIMTVRKKSGLMSDGTAYIAWLHTSTGVLRRAEVCLASFARAGRASTICTVPSHACSARTTECNTLSGSAADAAESTPATPQTDQLKAACGRPSKKPNTVERAWQSIDMEPCGCVNPHLSGENMSSWGPCCETHHFLMTTPWRRVARATFSSSDSEEHSLPSEYPHLLPPQSSLTRLPARVIP